MQSALPPSQPEPPAPGKAGRRFYISSAYIAGVHSWAAFGSLCCARDHRDRQRPGKTRSPAPACQHFHAPHDFRPFPVPLVCGYRSRYWELRYGSSFHDIRYGDTIGPYPVREQTNPNKPGLFEKQILGPDPYPTDSEHC